MALAVGEQRHHIVSRGEISCIIVELTKEQAARHKIDLAQYGSVSRPIPIENQTAEELQQIFQAKCHDFGHLRCLE